MKASFIFLVICTISPSVWSYTIPRPVKSNPRFNLVPRDAVLSNDPNLRAQYQIFAQRHSSDSRVFDPTRIIIPGNERYEINGGFVPRNPKYSLRQMETVKELLNANKGYGPQINEDYEVCTTPACYHASNQLNESMDLSANPCEDFYQYACGNWIKNYPMPEGEEMWGNFEMLINQVGVVYNDTLSADDKPNDSESVKTARNLFKQCIKLDEIDRLGVRPMISLLVAFGGWPIITLNWTDPGTPLNELVATLRRDHGVDTMFWLIVGVNFMDNSRELTLMPASLGTIPDCLHKPEKCPSLFPAYLEFMEKVMVKFGVEVKAAKDRAQDILNFEFKLAKAAFQDDSLPSLIDSISVGDAEKVAPGLKEYLSLVMKNTKPVEDGDLIKAYGLNVFSRVRDTFEQAPKALLYDYLLWRLVKDSIPRLDSELIELARRFKVVEDNETFFPSPPEPPVRLEACISTATSLFPWPTSRLFVDATLEPTAQEEAKSMVSDILTAFYELVDDNPWLDEETRTLAKEKAKSIKQYVGYPDFLVNNTELDRYFGKVQRGQSYFDSYGLIKFASIQANLASWKDPDSQPGSDWLSYPGVVNAFYAPSLNSITFPAGILQDPFFLHGRPKAMNYGAIGMVIGHEITHGFDDSGREFDKDGKQRKWWNDAMIKEFERRAECYVDQYNGFCPEELNGTICVDGKNTLGENIADNGGMRECYRAYRDWVKTKNGGKEEARLPGFEQLTPDQLLFIGYSHVWCGTETPEALKIQIDLDPHSPRKYRVFGPLSNSVEFRDVFKCKEGKMNRGAESCELW